MARHLLWLVSALIFVGLVLLIDSNSTQWVFLVRVQWVVLFGLMILPVLAHSFGRELLIGAYELNNRRAGFSCRIVADAGRNVHCRHGIHRAGIWTGTTTGATWQSIVPLM